jgi:hypothetical protein
MRLSLAVTLTLTIIMLLGGVSSSAAAPHLSVMRVYGEEDCVCVDFYLKDAIDREIIDGMRNGIPAQLSYRIDVWRSRGSWYDKLIRTVKYAYRMHYDNWDTLYTVSTVRDGTEERINAGDAAELVHLVCNQQRMKACRLRELNTASRYYLTISAEVKSLGAERVKEIDSWLGGDDADDSGGLLDFVIGVFTSKSKSAETKSKSFKLEGLSG